MLAHYGNGIALAQSTRSGLVFAISDDAIHWEKLTELATDSDFLPVFAPGWLKGTILCRGKNGEFAAVAIEDRKAAIQESFQLNIGCGEWYEAPPDPTQISVVQDKGGYRAFFSARKKTGKDAEKRGCIGTAFSRDLKQWEIEPPIFAPNEFPELFSPQVVEEAGFHAIFYSTSEHADVTTIRSAIAPHLRGPYERLEPDVAASDIRNAVHFIKHGARHLAFFARKHAANLSRPALLMFHADGRPFFRFYDRLLSLLHKTILQTDAKLDSSEILVRVLPRFGDDFRLSMNLSCVSSTAAGVLFRSSMTGHDNITLWLDFENQGVSLRRGVKGRLLARRGIKLFAGENYRLSIWAEGEFADIYLDDELILSCSTEGRKSGGFGLATTGGEAHFSSVVAQAIRP